MLVAELARSNADMAAPMVESVVNIAVVRPMQLIERHTVAKR